MVDPLCLLEVAIGCRVNCLLSTIIYRVLEFMAIILIAIIATPNKDGGSTQTNNRDVAHGQRKMAEGSSLTKYTDSERH